jgi:ABC-2 type transport system ATP-binding protein
MSAGAADLRPSLGYMPQDAAIYPDLSGKENLDFFASIYRARPDRTRELIAMLDLEDVAHRAVKTYSGGQRQRIALAAAMVPEPQLMLLDEPTVGLDPRLRVRLWDAFRSLAADGTTLVVSTHVMDEATRCDLVAFLSNGQLVAVGTPDELMERAGVSDLEAAVLEMTGSRSAVEQEEVRRVG